MTDRRTPTSDLFLVAWFEDGPTAMPDRVIDVVADRISRQRQRRAWRLLGRPLMNSYAKFGLATAAIVLLTVVGYSILPRTGLGPGGAPTPSPTVLLTTPATPTPESTQSSNPLVGRWASAPSTCADQNAAIQRAGYTISQILVSGWDSATCMQMLHGKTHVIQFLEEHLVPEPSGPGADGTLIEYADGAVGWEGYWYLVDANTFTAGDGGRAPYLTYRFTITGDQLVIDMQDNRLPVTTDAELWGDTIAQTVIYESLPFTRVR